MRAGSTHACKSAPHVLLCMQYRHTNSPTSTGPSALYILTNVSAPAVEIVSTPFTVCGNTSGMAVKGGWEQHAFCGFIKLIYP